MKKSGFVVLVLVLILALGFLTRGSLVKSAVAQYYGGCYVCAWDNEFQRFGCKMTEGSGGAFCGAPGGGEDCWLRFVCYPAN